MFNPIGQILPGTILLTRLQPSGSLDGSLVNRRVVLRLVCVLSALIICSLACLLPRPAYAQGFSFTPGNFYGTQGKTIVTYDGSGQQGGSLQVPNATELRGLAFGPDGLLYVVNVNGSGLDVFALDSLGHVRQTYSYSAWIGGNISWGKIAFDTHGNFYVGTLPGIVHFIVGVPLSGTIVPNTGGPYGIYDMDVLPSGNLLVADSYSIFEITSAGDSVRAFTSLTDIRGVAYDRATNQVFATELGNSGTGYFRLLRYDFTTTNQLGMQSFWYGDDIVLSSDGRLVVGSRTQAPGIFDKNLTQLGSFQGNPCMFVTQLPVHYKPDFNSDGQSDIVWQNRLTGDVSVWFMNGVQWTGSYSLLGSGVPTDWTVAGVGDLNGDGKPDFVWQNQTTGDVSYWMMNGTQRIDANVIARGVATDWKIAAVIDLNGDGKPDFVWQNKTTGDVSYWMMNGTKWVDSGYIAHGVPTQWKIVGAADFNQDGNADLVWQNSQTGDVVVWYMAGTQWSGNYAYIAQAIPTDWQVVSITDYNGDGQPDILWQNRSTGDVSYWLMNGTQWARSDSLYRGVPLQWHMAGSL